MKKVAQKNREQGRALIERARLRLEQMSLDPQRIKADFVDPRETTAEDICHLANSRHVDAVLMTRRGSSNMLSFFMGSVTRSVLEHSPACPVWIAGRQCFSNSVLLALENSPNALQAVDHTGKMLAGTPCRVTLFHAMRHLQRYIPAEVLEEAAELAEIWTEKVAQNIRPVMDKARAALLSAGLEAEQIDERITAGSRSAANDIMTAVAEQNYGTIVLAHRGEKSPTRTLFGSITAKVLNSVSDIAVWIV